nr:hypothetical protein [Tanacetum cinerariifolium]
MRNCFLDKDKVEWLKAGDRNSKYFHNVVKGQSSNVLPFSDSDSLFVKKLHVSEALNLVRIISNEEIKLALFDIDGNKAPGPDGFSSQFFKDSWSVVGDDVCKAVRDFFSNGKLLKEINATVFSLVPKVAAPSKVSDYRPIACCNVVYKIISKVICNRLKGVLGFLVDDNQSAFIPSRQISGNIMLSQELMRYYHRNRGPAKCAFKIDIENAYDSVEWIFLSNTLKHFGFPKLMVKWIMNCVTSTSFTVNVKGDHMGFFKGMRGLRQGDPLSPYLFTLVMKVFNLVLRREIDMNPTFRFHWQCKELKLTHLCFADDLLLFCNGDSSSVAVLKNAISIFGGLSGLLPNFTKSTVFFGNVKEVSRLRILNIMPFRVGSLPVRYLGVLLISKRLYVKDCNLLIDKARKRLLDWKNKSLYFAGRLQLIKSVLCSLQVYWAFVFILPTAIANDIERLMRDFLWNFGVFKRGKACVNWNSVCKPKVEGGLGIKSLDSWNKALMNGAWVWPCSISNSFDVLSVIPPSVLMHDKSDVVRWKSLNALLDRLKTHDNMTPQKRTLTQPASQPSTSSQVSVSETRNADGREMGDGVPTQSSTTVSDNGNFPMVDEEEVTSKKLAPMAEEMIMLIEVLKRNCISPSDNRKFMMVDAEDLLFKKISPMAEEILKILRVCVAKKIKGFGGGGYLMDYVRVVAGTDDEGKSKIRIVVTNLVMSSDSALSAVTYTSISSDSDALSWGIPFMNADESQSLKIAPLSLDCVPGPEEPIQTSLLPEYVPEPEDPKDDPKEDPADYPAVEGDEEEEESFGDDADDEDEVEAFEEEDDDEEEEEHLAITDSSTVPIDDLTPMAAATEALIAAITITLPSSSPPPSPLTSLSSLLPQIPSPPLPLPSPPLPLPAPSSPLLLPATSHRKDVPEADVPPQNKICLTAPSLRFKVEESSAATARQPGLDATHATDYGFVDTVDATPRRPMTWEDTREIYVRVKDAYDDRAFLRAQINMIRKNQRYFNDMAFYFKREAMYARAAWAGSEDRSAATEAHVRALKTHVTTLMTRTSLLRLS